MNTRPAAQVMPHTTHERTTWEELPAAVRLWEEIARDDPQPWKQRVHQAAVTWHQHRQRGHRD